MAIKEQSKTLTLNRTMEAAPEVVYRAFTTTSGLEGWFCDNSNLQAQPGGRLYMWSNDGSHVVGKFIELEPPRKIIFEQFGSAYSKVRVSIEGQDGESSLTLEHSELVGMDEIAYAGYAQLWEAALDNLQSVLETGVDQRFYSQPVLGIMPANQLNEENRDEYGVPVDYGVAISGVVAGMGAEKVGLRAGDVIVKLGEIPMTGFGAFREAIAPYKAGETVEITWYREGTKHEADMRLSGRPIPELPESLQDFAEQVRQGYETIDKELADIFEGVSEEEAEYRQAADEWNAKEVVAHLIATEQAQQVWIVTRVGGNTFADTISNDHALVKSIVDIYPTVTQLIAEMRRTEGQTVALLSRLPEEVQADKGTYLNIVRVVRDQLSYHPRSHFEQIQKALTASQGS